MSVFKNDVAIEHRSANGTFFSSPRGDLREGVTVTLPKGMTAVSPRVCQDMVEFGAWHAREIWPHLNGFSGYDTILYSLNP